MANSYLDKDGLLYFLQKIRPDSTPQMDGTASTGSAKRFALQDHVHPRDTTLAPKASPALTGTPTAPTAATGTNTTQIATTAFVQNTVGAMTSGVSDVKVDNTSVVTSGIANINTFTGATSSASGTKGLVPAPASGADNDFKVLTAAGNFSEFSLDAATTSGNLYVRLKSKLAGSSTAVMSPAQLPTATTSNSGVMSASDKTKLDNISGSTLDIVAGNNVTITPNTTNGTLTIAATDTTYTTGTASELTTGTGTNTRVWTPKVIADYVTSTVETAVTGAAAFQGTAPTSFAPTNYKAGYYWVVGTAGTYVGQTCEAGDMIFATADGTSYSASNFDVVQTNLDIAAITNSEIDTIVAS